MVATVKVEQTVQEWGNGWLCASPRLSPEQRDSHVAYPPQLKLLKVAFLCVLQASQSSR